MAFAVELSALINAPAFSSDTDAKWMHVATEGLYLGYKGGSKPFQLTRTMFDQAVRNVRAHPQYKLGPSGVGEGDVIPWDFDHASELDPTEGTKPFSGAPAQGWVLDLKTVDGPDGKAQLHALTRFMEPARGYVKLGKYKWASIAASFNAKDNVSGVPIGMVLTSVALTNQPFLQALAPLAASRRAAQGDDGGGVELKYFYQADTAEDAVCSLKDLFGLPATAGVAELLAECQKLRNWISTGAVPLGVDADEIVGSIRTIFGMDLTEPISAVLDKVPLLVNRLVEEEAMEAGEPVPMSGAGETDMALLSILANLLNCGETEPEVRTAVKQLVQLSDKLSALFGGPQGGTALLAAAADAKEKGSKADEVTAKLGTLFKALGVEDHAGAVGKVAGLMSQAAELEKAMPELKHLREYKAEQATASAARDVDAVLAANKWPDNLKPALLALRTTDAEKFAKDYPLPAAGTGATVSATHQAALQRPLVAGAGGVQLSAKAAAQSVGQGGAQFANDDDALLASMPGNATEKALAFLSQKQGEAFTKLPRDTQFKLAFDFNRKRRESSARTN